MSKEIKFKVWDKENNKMLHYDNDIVPCITLNGVLQDCSREVSSNVSHKYELMQFTGLHDKNGVEIYEGGIVRDGDDIFEIKFQEGRFVGVMDENIILDLSEFAEDCEVIGNIYENKELLYKLI